MLYNQESGIISTSFYKENGTCDWESNFDEFLPFIMNRTEFELTPEQDRKICEILWPTAQ